MRIDGIQLAQGSSISNLVVASGTSFPANPDEGELFFRTDEAVNVKGLYSYIGGSWDRIASTDSLSSPIGANFPASANAGDLFYRDSNDSNEGLFVYNGVVWVAAAASAPPSFTVTGDVTGTLDGGTDVLTLANSGVSAGAAGDSATVPVVTVNAKGLVTSLGVSSITLPTSRITSGTFADARIAQSNVTQHQAALSLAASQITSGTFDPARIGQPSITQHQAALSLAASQITSGTFDGARISQASVTQHQGSLSIAESQIPDGALLARVAGNETVTGSWSFNNPIVSAEPSSASHLTTKQYVDNALAGLTWKRSVSVATTTNITLSGTPTIDGVVVSAGSRVLVKNQTTASQNGVYVVAAGAWSRALDFDSTSPIDEVNGAAVFVESGSTQSDTGWTQVNTVVTVDTDAMAFVQFSASGAFTAGSGLTLNGNIFNIGTASSSRIVVNVDDIDLATVSNSGTGAFQKLNIDGYGRVTGTTPVVAADITGLVNNAYVAKAGDTMTGALATTSLTTTAGGVLAAGRVRAVHTAGQSSSFVGAASESANIVIQSDAGPGGAGGSAYWISAKHSDGQLHIGGNGGSEPTLGSIVISNTNNVGIGVANTTGVRLSLADGGQGIMMNLNSTAANGGYIRFQTSGTSIGDIGTGQQLISGGPANAFGLNARTGNSLVFATAQTERMRIDAAGNVGVGTTGPASFGKFVVADTNGTLFFTAPTAGFSELGYTGGPGNILRVGPVGYLSGGLALMYTSGAGARTEGMRITSSGDVGIGTASPVGRVSVVTPATSSGVIPMGLTLNNPAAYGGGTGLNGVGIRFAHTPNDAGSTGVIADIVGVSESETSSVVGALAFRTRTGASEVTTERMRITSSGELLIGSSVNDFGGLFELRKNTGSVLMDLYAGSSAETKIRFFNNNNNSAIGNGGGGDLVFYANSSNTERMRLDTLGNLGLGGAPVNSGAGWTTFTLDGSVGGVVALRTGGSTTGSILSNTSEFRLSKVGGGSITFHTGGVNDRMNILNNGQIGMGGNTTGVAGGLSYRLAINFEGGGALYGLALRAINDSTTAVGFVNASNVNVGAITITPSGTSYNTTSDARLKKNVQPVGSFGSVIDSIEVVSFDWKANDEHQRAGFIAQDLYAVAPEAVKVGDTNEVPIDAWGVDPSKLIPMLVKEIQELRARVAALESA